MFCAMTSATREFWSAYEKRELTKLITFNMLHTDIPFICFEVAAIVALYHNDIELLRHIDFPVRAVLEKVADRPEELRSLLSVIGKGRSIPDYVWEQTTPETREIFREYGYRTNMFSERRKKYRYMGSYDLDDRGFVKIRLVY